MENNDPPGHPGITPRWTSSRKSGIGKTISYKNSIWFTISHGILNEVYYPTVDNPNIRDLGFLVTNGTDFFSEEKRDTDHETTYIKTGIPAYNCINTCKQGRYRIHKTIFLNPHNNSLVQEVFFETLKGTLKDYKLYALLAPHVQGQGSGNDAWITDFKGLPIFYASKFHSFLAMACEPYFIAGSCGYVGTSDGYLDIQANKKLTNFYSEARDGNVAITSEVDLPANEGRFTIALSFGSTYSDAGRQAKGTLICKNYDLLKLYMTEWDRTLEKYRTLGITDPEVERLYRTSLMVLNVHRGKNADGCVIAGLSIPWGSNKGDNDLGGYHLIWPRDLVEIAGGFVAVGDLENARKILYYLSGIQEADGHFAQCLWHDGYPYWTNIQMDETALPILLANCLKHAGALDWIDAWPLVSKAAAYLACNGPVTPQDRWEEDGGYTPFTLAAEIAALLAAADFFEDKELHDTATYLKELADNWNSNIEKWTYRTNTELTKQAGVEGYYVRITPDKNHSVESAEDEIIEVKNRPPDHRFNPASDIISTDALALVRFGLRRADDPHMINTVKVIDTVLKTETKKGVSWRRYNEDGYGEHEDGSPFDGTGIGRSWPLLVGERAHYELAKGNPEETKRLLAVMTKQAGMNSLISEQIWDTDDIEEKSLINGEPTLGAQPLVWAHAEYIKLLRSIQQGSIFDTPTQTTQRYLIEKTGSDIAIWRFNHKCHCIAEGKKLRVETTNPAKVKWSIDGGKTENELDTKDTLLGIYYVDLPTENLNKSQTCQFTFYWIESNKWDKEIFTVTIHSKEDTTCN